MRLVLGTLAETITRNHNLSFIFHQLLRLFCRTITKCVTRSYCIMSIVLGKNKHVNICLPMSTKLGALNHLRTYLISLSFCSNHNQKRVFIVAFFPFSNDYSMLRPYFGANIILDITFISNYIRYKEHQFCANMHAAGSEVN